MIETPDTLLYKKAIAATGLSDRRFAMHVLGVSERGGRYWKDGDRALPAAVRIVCRAIIRRPMLASELMEAHALLVEGDTG
jgi:hypothetical protein